MGSLNETPTSSESRLERESSVPSWDDAIDTLVAFDPIEPTDESIDDLGIEGRAEFERLRAFLDLVEEPVPTEVGRYRIERVIGRGGMGIVHLAEDPYLERSVALKLVHAGPFVNRERLHSRLQREARVLARVTHPNVVAVYDVGTHDREFFVTMEYVPGTNLRVWQDAEPRTRAQVLDAYLQAAHGLSAVHRVGIIHRDFKPDNVLIADDGRVLVGDFGLAHDRDLDVEPDDGDETSARPADFGRTHTGALMGTLRYMAPERLCGEPASKASDQFEFCVSLWEALTGRRPFVGEGRDGLAASMSEGPRGGAKLDRHTRRVLERGLARAPEQRYPDFDALIDALRPQSNQGLWFGVIGLAVIVALVITRIVLEPTCEVGDRITDLGGQTLMLPDGSSDSAAEAVQDRFDRIIVELRDEASTACRNGEPGPLAQLDRWVDVLEMVAENSDELPITRTLETLSELQFERDREPPELVDPEVARLIDEAREHTAMGRLAEAEQATERAGEIAESRSDRAEVSLRLGQLAAWRGRPAAALEHYEDAAENADAAGLDRHRLAAHLLASPLALAFVEDRELAEQHHEAAALLLERLDLDEDDAAWIDHDEHAASLANERGEFDVALVIQTRALERWIAEGEPLAIAESRQRLALIHQTRSAVVKDPEHDLEAAAVGYRRVLEELDALDVAPSHPTRLKTHLNLGLLLLTPDATPTQLDEVWAYTSPVVEAGPSDVYITGVHVLLAVLLDRFINTPSPSPELMVEAERLGTMLKLELQAEDLAPRDRLDAWTIVATLHALQGDMAGFEAADAKVYELAKAAVANGILTAVEHDIQLAAHTMQIVRMFEPSNRELAHRYAQRAAKLAEGLPSEAKENPGVALLVADIADAANAPDVPVPR